MNPNNTDRKITNPQVPNNQAFVYQQQATMPPNHQPRTPFNQQRGHEDPIFPPTQLVFGKQLDAQIPQTNNREQVFDSVTIQNQPRFNHQLQPSPLPPNRGAALTFSEGEAQAHVWSFLFCFCFKRVSASQFVLYYHNTIIGYLAFSILPVISLAIWTGMYLFFEGYDSIPFIILLILLFLVIFFSTALCLNCKALSQVRSPKERLTWSKTATTLGVIAAVVQGLVSAFFSFMFLAHFTLKTFEYYYRSSSKIEIFTAGFALSAHSLFSMSLLHLGLKTCRAADEVDKKRKKDLVSSKGTQIQKVQAPPAHY